MNNGPSFTRHKLGDISESIEYGFTASANKEPVGPRFLRITDIQNDNVSWEDVPFCECPDADMERYELREGDIVFARTGATTGKSYLIRECPESAVFASYLIRVRPSSKVSPDFLSQFFRTPDYWSQISGAVNGSTQPGVNGTKLKELQVPLPPLPEQRRLAAILDKADAIRRKREEGIRLTEELLRSTFLEMFGDPVTNPKGWPVVQLNQIANIVMGSSPPSESYNEEGKGLPLINGPVEFSKGMLGHTLKAKYTTQPTQTCNEGDLLLCVRGSTTGRTNIAGFHACIGRGVAAIRSNQCQDFLAYLMTLKRQTLFDTGNGTTFPSITQEQLRNLSVIAPSKFLQEKFSAFFRNLRRIVFKRIKANMEAEILFASLVQRAFRGEL